MNAPRPCPAPTSLLSSTASCVGRYAILSPYANGKTEDNYRRRSQFSQMVAVDLSDFTVEGVSVVDLAATSRQQARSDSLVKIVSPYMLILSRR